MDREQMILSSRWFPSQARVPIVVRALAGVEIVMLRGLSDLPGSGGSAHKHVASD
jgi:hypothetical protein